MEKIRDNLQDRISRIKKNIDDNLEKTRKTRLQFNSPEQLTLNEIDKILEKLPRVNSIDHDTGDISRQYIMDKIKHLLRLPINKIVKSAVPELIKIIINTFNRAKAEPGMPVGLLAAQAISSQLMQATLNTFHQSGSKKNVESGIKAYEDMLNVRPNMSSPSCDIYFKDNVTFNDIIYDKRPKLVQVLVDDLLIDTDILNKMELYDDNGFKYPHYMLYNSMYSTQSFNFLQHIKVPDINDPTDRSGMTFLRLTIDTDKIYKYQITTGDICKAIMKSNDSRIICIPSPIIMQKITTKKLYMVGNVSEYHNITRDVPFLYIDIFTFVENVKREIADEFNSNKNMESILNDTINQAYFNTIVLPGFKKIIVKGLHDITNIYPEKLSIWSAIEEEITYDGQWILRYNESRMEKTGINVDHIITLCNKSKIEVISSDSHHLIVKTPEKPGDERKILNIDPNNLIRWNPGQVINYIKLKELDTNNEYAKNMRELRNKLMVEKKFSEADNISTIPPASDFELSLNFMYAVSDGSNLIDLLQDEDIDPTRTISNNTREILQVFGIEAARSFYIEQLHKIIKMNDNYVDTRHIMIVADHITRLGFITPFTQKGMEHHPIGTLTLAAHQKPSQHLHSMAITGKSESLKATYPALLTGTTVSLGTGIVNVSMNKKKEKEFMDKFKIKEMYNMKIEELSSVVEHMEEEEDDDNIYDTFAVYNNEGVMIGTSFATFPSLLPSLEISQMSPSLIGAHPQSSLGQIRSSRKSPVVPETIQERVVIRSITTPTTVLLPGSTLPIKIGLDVLPEGIVAGMAVTRTAEEGTGVGGLSEIEEVVSFPTFTQDTGSTDIMKNIISIVQKQNK